MYNNKYLIICIFVDMTMIIESLHKQNTYFYFVIFNKILTQLCDTFAMTKEMNYGEIIFPIEII